MLGCVGPACCIRIRELTGPPSFNEINSASDLPALALGVLCVLREPDVPAGAEGAPGVVAAALISEPVCEFSRRSVVVGIVPALLVTTVGVGRTETNCGPWSTVGSTDDCFSLFAALPFPPLVFAASRELSSDRFRLSVFSVSSADRSASRSCCISCSSAALRGGGGSICVN